MRAKGLTISVATIAISLCYRGAFAQENAPQEPAPAPTIEVMSIVRTYPSLRRATLLKVPLTPFRQDLRTRGMADTAARPLDRPEDWVVQRANGSPLTVRGSAADIPRGDRIGIEKVDTSSEQGYALLFLNRDQLQKGDQLAVGVRGPAGILRASAPGQPNASTVATQKSFFENFTFKLVPSQVPDQELVGGNTKNVWHFALNLENPALLRGRRDPRVYFLSDNTLSTQNLDKTACLEVKNGAYWSFKGGPQKPDDDDRAINLDQHLTSNQAVTNMEYVVSLGLRNPFGKRWANNKTLLPFLKSEYSPLISLDAQYATRFLQDPRLTPAHANRSKGRLFGQLRWDALHLFAGRKFSPNDIGLEVLAKGWWFPDETATGGIKARHFEGRIEVSLLVPLGNYKFLTPDGGAGTRIRLRYVSGADEANGFQTSSEFQIGLEMVTVQ